MELPLVWWYRSVKSKKLGWITRFFGMISSNISLLYYFFKIINIKSKHSLVACQDEQGIITAIHSRIEDLYEIVM